MNSIINKQIRKKAINELQAEGLYINTSNSRPPIPQYIRDAVWVRDQGRCVYCGSAENLQFDHIIPFSKGGATSIENLQILCRDCNIRKSNHIGYE